MELRRRKEGFGITVVDAERVPTYRRAATSRRCRWRRRWQRCCGATGSSQARSSAVLPREFCTIKHFELPSIDRAQIEQMVPFEAEKHLPFAVARAILDCYIQPQPSAEVPVSPEDADENVLPEDETEEQAAARKTAQTMQAAGAVSMITLAAARQAVIARLLELLQGGFRQHAITVSLFALYNAFSYWRRSREIEMSGDAVLIDIGARRSEIRVAPAERGELVFSRALSFGGDAFTEHMTRAQGLSFEEAARPKCEQWDGTCFYNAPEALREVLAPFIEQAQSSLRFAVRQGLLSGVGAARRSGGTANVPGLADAVHAAFGVPVTLFDALSALGGKGTDAQRRRASRTVLGAALRTVDEARMVIDLAAGRRQRSPAPGAALAAHAAVGRGGGGRRDGRPGRVRA